MPEARHSVRNAAPPRGDYFDERLWPVFIALIVLGSCLIGVSLAYQPLSGVPWHGTAWPTLIGVPVAVITSMLILTAIDNRNFRRSLQLSLILAAILHVCLIVQMVETKLFSGIFDRPRPKAKVTEPRPVKLMPHYHESQLLPEEDRPRQDFEKPVESAAPIPTTEPQQVVRQPLEQDRLPSEPQPVPVPYQEWTTEPNVVNRQNLNEVAPRLAAQPSRLSRQSAPSPSRTSEPVAMPRPMPEPEPRIQAQPQASALARAAAETPAVSEPRAARAELQPVPQATAINMARSTGKDLQPALSPAADTPRRELAAATAPNSPTLVAAPTASVAPPSAEPSPSPARVALSRSQAGLAGAGRSPNTPTSAPGQPSRAPTTSVAARRVESTNVNIAVPSPQPVPLTRASGAPPVALASAQVAELPTGGETSGQQAPSALTAAAGGVTRQTTASTTGVATALHTAPSTHTSTAGYEVAIAGPRQPSAAEADAPSIGDIAPATAPGRRARPTEIIGASTNVAEIPEVGPMSAVAQAEHDHLLRGIGQTTMRRQNADAVAANVKAPAGPGGLGTEYSPEVGIDTRQARSDSLDLTLRSSRFVRSQVGGLPAVSTAAIVPAEAFSGRAARVRGNELASGRGAPQPQTEEAIERGLAFLARHQKPDGRWSLQGFPEEAQLATDTAATALALIAFQGAGYSHREFQYKDVVKSGLDFLINSQRSDGDLFVPLDDASNRSVWLYSHSLAAIALCEAYGMTQDPGLRAPAQRAIDFIAASQDIEHGGWRYSPAVGSDTSVTGWMMMALKSGELAGLNVSRQTYARINAWLDGAQQSRAEPHLYRYNPYAPDTSQQRHGRRASKTMTSVGLLMRLYGGWKRDNANMIRGAHFLADNLPAIGTTSDPQRDTYYWYYATQVMAHMGGDYWQAWSGRLHPLLVDSQVREGSLTGSWDPQTPIPDRWGPHAGRLYITTMNLLSLEVQYRKLPLYEGVIR
jgi:hypothetical protein